MNTQGRRQPPVPGPGQPVRFPAVTRFRLSNGLAVWFVERGQLPFVSVALHVPAGSIIDPDNLPGVAALTADMLDEGANGRSAIEIQETFGRLGTALDTEAGSDAVLLSFSLLPRNARGAVSLLADLVMRPSLTAEDFERVRTLRGNRVRQLRNSPSALADQAFVRAVFGTHPYGHQPWGLTEAIERMRVEDVVRVHQTAYRPAACVLIVVGSLPAAEVADMAESAFGAWESGSGPIFDAGWGLTPSSTTPRLLLVDRPGAAQTELRIGHAAVGRRTPDYHALVLLNAMLGGQFVSRINLNLRERKAYTYGAHTAFDFRRLAGAFVLQTSVQTDATTDAIGESLKEIAAIGSDRPPTADEIDFGRGTLARGYARNFETAGQIAHALTQLATHDLPDDTFDRFVPGVNAVQADELHTAARRHLRPDELIVVAVGDRAAIEAGLPSLGLGGPVVTAVEV